MRGMLRLPTWAHRGAWAVAAALLGPLAFGLTPNPDELSLPEVVIRGIDRVRLEARREGVVSLEPARIVEATLPVDFPPPVLPSLELTSAPEVRSPGCGYRGALGAVNRTFGAAEPLYRSALDSLSRDALDEAAGYLAELRARYPEDPRSGDAAFWLGEIRRRQGRTDEALAFLRLTRGKLAPEAVYRRGWLLSTAGRPEEAERLWAQIGDDPANPHRPEALYRLGGRRLDAGDPAEAAVRFGQVLELRDRGVPMTDDVEAGALLGRGLSLREAGDGPGAETALVRFLLARPDHPSAPAARVALGWTLLELHKPEEAALRFGWVLEAGVPPELEARAAFGRVRAQAERGDADAARAAQADLEARNPLGPWVGWGRAELGWLAVRQGRSEDALKWYRSAREVWLGSGGDVVRYMEAESLYLLGRYPEAVVAFDSVTPSGALRPASLHRGGVCALLSGDPQAAEVRLQQVLDDFSGYPERDRVRVWLGESLVRQGRPAQAERVLIGVLPASPSHGAALYGLAWISFEAGRWAEAANRFDALLRAHPDDPNRDEARLTLARAHFNRRALAPALSALTRLEETAASGRQRSAARFYRGWMLARSGDPMAARATLGKLVADEPEGPFTARALHTLAWLDFGSGQYEAAAERFDAVLALDPTGEQADEARLKRADSLYNLGRYDDALSAYRQVEDDGEARYGAALCLMGLERYDQLEREVAAFVEERPEDPRSPDLLLALARTREERSDPEGASLAYAQAARLWGDGRKGAEARLRSARSQALAGNEVEARAELTVLGERDDEVGLAALRQLAGYQVDQGVPEQLVSTWDLIAARTEGLDRADALRAGARWAREAEDWPGARSRLEDALRALPPEAVALRQSVLVERGEVLWAAGDGGGAEDSFIRSAALGRSPEGARALLALGRLQQEDDRADEALETYLRMGYLYPVTEAPAAEALVHAAELLEGWGDGERARSLYGRVVEGGADLWAETAAQRLAAPTDPKLRETNP